MATATRVLKPGESIELGDHQVTIAKCGLHSQGGAPSSPSVTVVIESPDPENTGEGGGQDSLDSENTDEYGGQDGPDPENTGNEVE